jgi:pyrroline-5-carboxylate reductase
MSSSAKKVLFLGAGNMGGAIICALTDSGYPHGAVLYYEPSDQQAKKIAKKSKAVRIKSLSKEFSQADVIFLCLKPQVFSRISSALRDELEQLDKKFLIISVMAGISVASLRAVFSDKSTVVRVMPNVAVSVKEGTVAIAIDGVKESDLQTVEFFFSSFSNTVRVLEYQMDAVTGLSGSGPAFVFQFVEALAMGGVKMGLQRDIAMRLAISTVRGSVEMLDRTDRGTGELTAEICSPAGTTITGLHELEKKSFRSAVISAIEAAAKRSAELGKLALILIFLTFFSMPLPAQQQEPNLKHLAMCSGVKQCLNYDYPQCSAADKKPNPDIKYNAEFCAPYIELKQRGLKLNDPKTYDLFRYMGRQYRVIYKVTGKLPVSKETMMYLFGNMDFTAHLVNAYRKTKYTITYDTPDKKNFSGDNGDNLFGSFVWLLSDSAGVDPGMHHVFFGRGRSKFLAWKLHGTATAILDLKDAGPETISYEFRALVSPSGPMLNSIMNLTVFKNLINKEIQGIITNIENSAIEFSKGNRKPIEIYPEFVTSKWKRNLQEFETIVKKNK